MEVRAHIRQHYTGAPVWDAFVDVVDGEPRCVWHRWFRTEAEAIAATTAEAATWTNPQRRINTYGMVGYEKA